MKTLVLMCGVRKRYATFFLLVVAICKPAGGAQAAQPDLLLTADTSSIGAAVSVARPEVVTSTASGALGSSGEARGWATQTPTEYEDVLLFVPRLALYPPKILISAIALPFQGALYLVNRYKIIEHVEDLLYNDERTAAILPFFYVLPGQGLTGGIKAFHKDLFGHKEKGSVSARYNGLFTQAYEISLGADRFLGSHLWLETQLRYERKPGLNFSGIGDPPNIAAPSSPVDPSAGAFDTVFQQERVMGRMRLGTTYGPPTQRLKIGGSLVFNHRVFGPGEGLSAGERSIETIYDTALLPGFDSGTNVIELTADLILDFRDRQGFTSSGIFLEAFAGGAPLQKTWEYVHYGVELQVFLNLYRRTRVLELRAALEGVEGDESAIPFSQLPRLGGPNRLRGYGLDSFRSKRVVLTSAEYRYPVHKNLAGQLFVDAGRVIPEYGEFFSSDFNKGWRFGYGGGLIMGSDESTSFRLDVSFGDGLMVYLSTEPLMAFSQRTEEL